MKYRFTYQFSKHQYQLCRVYWLKRLWKLHLPIGRSKGPETRLCLLPDDLYVQLCLLSTLVYFDMNVLSYLVLGFVGLINWLQFLYVQELPWTPILFLSLYNCPPHRSTDDIFILFFKSFSGFMTDRVVYVCCFWWSFTFCNQT